MKKEILLFTILSMSAKIIAFCRELSLSFFYGAGKISDVFLLSMTIPVTIFGFIASGVVSGYIPTYQEAKDNGDRNIALKFTNNVINLITVFCLTIIIIYFIIPKQLLSVFASGFDDNTLDLSQKFTNLSIWTSVITAIVTVLSGYLQINNKITITALISIPLNFGIIITIVTSKIFKNIYILPFGFLFSSILQLFFVSVVCIRNDFKYSLWLNFKDKYIKKFLKKLVLLIFSSSMIQVNILIDRTLATQVIVGGLSLFEYGSRICDFVMGLTIIPISGVIFPIMTKNKKDDIEFCKILTDGIRLSSIIIIPISAVMIIFSEVVVSILYYRGAFSLEDVINTSDVVKFYGFGIIAFSYREIITKCFYSIDNIKSPLFTSVIGIAFNIILNFIFLRILGIGGLAFATSLSAFFSTFLLYTSLKKSKQNLILGNIFLFYLGMSIIAIIFCYFALKVYEYLNRILNYQFISFIISVSLYFSVYIFIIILTGIISKNDIKVLLKK